MKRRLKIVRNVFLILLVILAAGLLAVSRSKALGLVHPVRTEPARTPDDAGIASWESVEFETPDGLRLSGWYIPPDPASGGAALIYVHGLGNNRDHLLAEAGILHRHGYGGLLFDLRNHGASEGELTTFGIDEVKDVRGAFDYLAGRPEVDPDRIGILGHSMGAAISLMAAADIPTIKVVVSESAYANLQDNIDYSVEALTGLPAFPFADLIVFFAQNEAGFKVGDVSPIDGLDRIVPRPILFIQGRLDEKVHVDNAQWLFAAAGEPKEIYLIDDAMHRINLVEADPEAFERVLVAFLDRYLLTQD